MAKDYAEVFSVFQKYMEEEENVREAIRVICKEMEQTSREIITILQGVHKPKGLSEITSVCQKARDQFAVVKNQYVSLQHKVPVDEFYRYHDHWRFVTQRFIFSAAFIVYLETGKLIGREEAAEYLGISANPADSFHVELDDFLLGLLLLAEELFPREMFQLVNNLRTLDISNNKIGELPSTIESFTHLKNFTACQIRITSLPTEIGSLKKLESVNFSLNELTSLPESFASLVNLRTINLSNNKFREFPSVFNNMKKLDLLDLSHNKLTAVPDHVKDVSATEINLNQNQIASLSEAISECSKLKVLRLEENCLQLAAVPDKILADSQISLLAIEGNLFESKDLQRREGWEKYMERFTATKKKLY